MKELILKLLSGISLNIDPNDDGFVTDELHRDKGSVSITRMWVSKDGKILKSIRVFLPTDMTIEQAQDILKPMGKDEIKASMEKKYDEYNELKSKLDDAVVAQRYGYAAELQEQMEKVMGEVKALGDRLNDK